MGAGESVLTNYEVGKPYEVETSISETAKSAKSRSSRHVHTQLKDGLSDDENGPKRLKYQIRPAVHKENGSSISVLVFEKERGTRSPNGSGYAEVLRMVRHPSILKFIGVAESDRYVKLLTEDVLSLEYCIHDLEDFEIISGLHNILEALIFLHEKGCLVHKNLCWSSVFVSRESGSWKLGGMEKVEKLSPQGAELDVINFADLSILLLGLVDNSAQEENKFMERLEELKQHKHDDNNSSYLGTIHLKALLDDPIFRNSYLEISKFLNDITMKNESEKEVFFRTLADELRTLDPGTVARKFLSRLFSKLILIEPSAEKFFIPQLLAFGEGYHLGSFQPIFHEDIYRNYCVPLIINLIFCDETHVRLLLLKYMSLFVKAIDKETLQYDVLPEILIGVRDENEAIVCATLHALACLVPILGGNVVIGGERSRLFKDQRPKFPSRIRSESSTAAERCSGSDSPSPVAGSKHHAREILQKKNEERKRRNQLRRQLREAEKQKEPDTTSSQTKQTSNINKCHRDTEPSFHDNEPSLRDTEPSLRDTEPSFHDNEPSLRDTEPSFHDNEPSLRDTEPSLRDTEPSLRDTEPSLRDTDTTRREDSEPDWEGFEAFSSESESEEEDEGSRLNKSTKSAENLLLIAKDSLSMSQIEINSTKGKPQHYPVQRVDKLPTRNAMVLGEAKPIVSEFQRLDSASSNHSIEPFQTDNILLTNDSSFKKPEKKTLTGLSITTEKKKTSNLQSRTKKKLGEEFELQISVSRSREPDFFADMTPDLTKSTTVLIEPNLPHVSSKFEAAESSSEVTSGWEEDGWDDFA